MSVRECESIKERKEQKKYEKAPTFEQQQQRTPESDGVGAEKNPNIFQCSSTIKIAVERVNQKRCLVEFAGYITLAGNQQ